MFDKDWVDRLQVCGRSSQDERLRESFRAEREKSLSTKTSATKQQNILSDTAYEYQLMQYVDPRMALMLSG